MTAKVLIFLALVAAAAEGGSHEHPHGPHGSHRSHGSHESYGHHRSYDPYEFDVPKYEYSYQIKDYYGNDFGHKEGRDGDYTEGRYYNHMPDGRLMKVKYFVDGYSGYVADVSYEGEARYDSGSYESHNQYGPTYDSGSHEYYRPRYHSGSQEYYK